MKIYHYIGILCMVFGCTLAKVNVNVVSERTALENQILGTYNALDREMLLVASVRGVDARGNITAPPKKSQEQKDAVAAMQLLDFHADDIQMFKKLKWVGENNKGLLEPFGVNRNNIPENMTDFSLRYSKGEFSSVVAQVNQAREVIMQRVIDMNENLTDSDLPEVRKIFAKLNADKAETGEKIQKQDGTWIESVSVRK